MIVSPVLVAACLFLFIVALVFLLTIPMWYKINPLPDEDKYDLQSEFPVDFQDTHVE